MIFTRKHLAIVILIGLVALGLWWRALPKPLFDDAWSTVIYARNGELLGAQIAEDGQWRLRTLRVPQRFEQALLAYEDKRFYEHPGVDVRALLRAAYLNVRARRIASGGSTLTMQTIRLARGRDGSRWWDKAAEASLALRLEVSASKREILLLYAQHAPFGGNVVGLEAAAWRYFGRSAEQLSWAETCTLAVLPNSPALVHPGRQRAALQHKRDLLLKRLYARGVLEAAQLELALSEPLIEEPRALPQVAPHALATLRAQSPKTSRFESTLNADLQRRTRDIVREHAQELAKQDIRNAAVLVVDNRSFEVLAYIGNSEWSVENDGYAVDIVRRPRSTGSILKPFLYAAMLESGDLAPRMLLPDVPTQFGGYRPENYDRAYRGAVPADVALAQSLNVPAVRMLQEFGVARFHNVLTQLGLTTLTRAPEDYGLALILGGAEGTLWDLTQAYANLTALARDATERSRVYRSLQVDANAKPPARAAADIGPGAAWLTLRALTEVARPGEEGHWKNFSSSRAIAWKTGTSWGLRDAWAIGSSSRYTVGVWVGNASGEGRPGLIGGVAAAPLLFAMMKQLSDAPPIAPPLAALKTVDVCKNDGYLANGDCERERQWLPVASHFHRLSPHNVRVHLDRDADKRVDGECASVVDMRHESWFVLPPAQEYYYRRAHVEYRPLPPMRADCAAASSGAPLDFLYPTVAARVYAPRDFGATRGRVVFEAVHRERDATLYWHLDDRYLGATQLFHQQAVDIEPGEHWLTLVDAQGHRKTRRFEVLSGDEND